MQNRNAMKVTADYFRAADDQDLHSQFRYHGSVADQNSLKDNMGNSEDTQNNTGNKFVLASTHSHIVTIST